MQVLNVARHRSVAIHGNVGFLENRTTAQGRQGPLLWGQHAAPFYDGGAVHVCRYQYCRQDWRACGPVEQGKLLGQKPPLKLREILAIRTRLQLGHRSRELALFNLATDSIVAWVRSGGDSCSRRGPRRSCCAPRSRSMACWRSRNKLRCSLAAQDCDRRKRRSQTVEANRRERCSGGHRPKPVSCDCRFSEVSNSTAHRF